MRSRESMRQDGMVKSLEELLESENLDQVRAGVRGLLKKISPRKGKGVPGAYLEGELRQILEARTLERARYYVRRLVKALSVIRTGRVNDINLNRWKEYGDIITDSLWLLERRGRSGEHSASYWGNFVPQIPNQLLRRYTKPGDWVLDAFLGSGTTLIECRRLGRNGIGVELQESVARAAEKAIKREKNPGGVRTEVIAGDCTGLDYAAELARLGVPSAQLLIMHPPYWDIIRFSDDEKDLSNAPTMEEFLASLGAAVERTHPVLDEGRYFALVIGDKYAGGEWVPLGFLAMQEVLKRGYALKSIIVKNFDATKGKRESRELWHYRALVGGFYIFKHEYIFLFRKK